MDSKEEVKKFNEAVEAFMGILRQRILTEEERKAEIEKAKERLGSKPLGRRKKRVRS